MESPSIDLPQVFHALGDPTRWDILQRVGDQSVSASGLAQSMPVSRQAIAKHLDVLQEVGLVSVQKVGREVQYRADSDRIATTASALERIASGWKRRLHAIRDLAEAEPDT